jgi:hypothetical protein
MNKKNDWFLGAFQALFITLFGGLILLGLLYLSVDLLKSI